MASAKEFVSLFEDRFDWLRDNLFSSKRLRQLLKLQAEEASGDPDGVTTDEAMAMILRADPTVKGKKRAGKFSEWILWAWLSLPMGAQERFIKEDWSKTKDDLKAFMKAQQKGLLLEPDINKAIPPKRNAQEMDAFTALWDLLDHVRQKHPEVDSTRMETIMRGTHEVPANEGYKIVIPHSHEASKFWGKGTRWCTAADSDDSEYFFNDYTKDGPLFIIIDPSNRKFQLHFESNQYMDKEDRPLERLQLTALISLSGLKDQINQNPQWLSSKGKMMFGLYSGDEKIFNEGQKTALRGLKRDNALLALKQKFRPIEGAIWELNSFRTGSNCSVSSEGLHINCSHVFNKYTMQRSNFDLDQLWKDEKFLEGQRAKLKEIGAESDIDTGSIGYALGLAKGRVRKYNFIYAFESLAKRLSMTLRTAAGRCLFVISFDDFFVAGNQIEPKQFSDSSDFVEFLFEEMTFEEARQVIVAYGD